MKKYQNNVILFILAGFFLINSTGFSFANTDKPRILYVDSYHRGYGWSDGITDGILGEFNCKLNDDDRVDAANSAVELRIIRMDTKRNSKEEFKKAAALSAKRVIEEWKPDIVIVSDDNAAKYLLAAYYKNHNIPFVFCGVNWDASMYGFPCKNITGMVEVILFKDLIHHLTRYAKGNRVGFLSQATSTNRKDISQLKKLVPASLVVMSVRTKDEWKNAFVQLQADADMVILSGGAAGMDHWDAKEMQRFTRSSTAVPTGCMDSWMKQYALMCFMKDPKEQGIWAAQTALRILKGADPSDIPIVQNHMTQIYLNMNIAKRLGVKFPMSLIEIAHIVEFQKQKILYVNSYHKGYEWSDAIEKGLHKVFQISSDRTEIPDSRLSDINLQIVRMDTKRNRSKDYLLQKAKQVRLLIEEWQPDILITSDDNAAEYVVMPYYRDASLPVVFCGINRDASSYGFPAANITGMTEVDFLESMIELLGKYTNGKRIGYIGADVISIQNVLRQYKDRLAAFDDGGLVSTFSEWKTVFKRLQTTTDMIVMLSPIGITDWDQREAKDFILENIRIPSGTCAPTAINQSLIGVVKVPEELGWWAGQTALAILNGKSPRDIPIEKNKEKRLYLNMNLANKLKIKFPVDLLEKAILLNDK